VADDTVLVYDEGGAAADEPLLVEDAVGFDRLPLDVAQQGEGHADVLLEPLVGGITIDADPDDLRVALLEIGDISLIRLQLFRSTACEGQHVEGERDVLLAPEIRELNGLALGVGEGEVRRGVADLQVRRGRAWRPRWGAAIAAIRNRVDSALLGRLPTPLDPWQGKIN